MKLTIMVLFALVAVAMCMPTPDSELSADEWEGFKKTYNKVYANQAEEEYRKKIYLKNKKMIEEHNKGYKAGSPSVLFGINQFTDLTPDDMKIYYGFKIDTAKKN